MLGEGEGMCYLQTDAINVSSLALEGEGGELCMNFCLPQITSQHISRLFIRRVREKNNNYFVATFLKISFEPQTAQSNLVTPVHQQPAHSARLANKRIHKNKIT